MATPCTISVLLTAHNCEKYITHTLESLNRACNGVQDDVEIILLNDASSDRTSQFLHAFADKNPQAKVFDVAFNNIGKIRNFGVSQCSGKYVTMLDGDDQLMGETFLDIIKKLKESEPDLLLTPLNEVYENKPYPEIWNGLKTHTLTQHQIIEKFLIHRDVQAHFIGQFVKRDVLAQHTFPEFSCYEDAYLFPSILKASKKILFAEQGPYLYFKRATSLSNTLNEEKISLLIKATEKMDAVLGESYRNLLSCHWINIYHKFGKSIKNEQEQQTVRKFIRKISFFNFLSDIKVRTSFKKKYLKIKLMKK